MLEGIMRTLKDAAMPNAGCRAARRRNAQGQDLLILGKLSIALTDRLIEIGAIQITRRVSTKGEAYLCERGIVIDDPGGSGRKTSRPLCRPCLDWSERRFHIAGKLGAAICTHFSNKAMYAASTIRARS